mmetsp:Transcript_17619/g.15532  ORF Transcript_17619/g.15532 Transcript_17619/m.15532 type:complete len:107 (-) Transcript_17619:455-775(-)
MKLKMRSFYEQKLKDEKSNYTKFKAMMLVDQKLKNFKEKLKKSLSGYNSIDKRNAQGFRNVNLNASKSRYTDDLKAYQGLSGTNSESSFIINQYPERGDLSIEKYF